ncbi:MAG TPA: hypothetical protein VJ913_09485 [Actinomycetota bacterium]|nr:hypothetical protein [Actinomycetota bacterium]
MSELREVFEMVTKQAEPDVDAWREQERRQRRKSRNRKLGALAIAAAIGLVAVVVVIRAVDDPTEPQPGGQGDTNAILPVPILPTDGTVDPGRYLFTPDPNVDASYTITMEVPEGYLGFEGLYIQKPGTNQTGLLVMAIDDVHADACQWRGTRSEISSTDEAVAALVSQKGIRTTAPTEVTLDGFAGTYMERTIPARASQSDCDMLEFRAWVETGGGPRGLGLPGQVDLLWILDVDGIPLVIDVALEPGASAQQRAELLQVVESVRIDPA